MRLSDLTSVLGAERHGRDIEFSGCTTDSRKLSPGALFVALRGPHFDGHDFVDAAFARGAAAAVLDHPIGGERPNLVIPDTRRALGLIAAHWRRRFRLPLVAVTGSNGKTTVKEMLMAILSRCAQVLGTQGNLNNDIGVPLTLFNLDERYAYAVIEMGANHPGEIAALCELAQPSVAVVTQCSPAHLKGFGSIEGVARAKGEIFTQLGPGDTAVINADDPYAGLWRTLAGGCRQLSFGFEASPDVTATVVDTASVLDGSKLRLHTPAGSIDVHLQLLGRHNISNALAAAASALALGIGLEDIAAGLQSMRAVQGRLQPRTGRRGTRVFDDSYNANPGSLKAALEFLASCPGEPWLVLGDMAELGPEAAGYHHQAGVLARHLGIQRLYATGDLARASVDGFGPGGRYFATVDTLVESLGGDLHPRVTVLVKGSRSMRMERVVGFLQQEGE